MKKIPDNNKEHGFRVPDGYFEYLPDKILNKIQDTYKRPERKGIFYLLIKPHFAYAASIIVFVLIVYTGYHYIGNKKITPTLTPEDISRILENKSYDMDEDLLVNMLLNETDYGINNTSKKTQEIIDYLVEDQIEYELIRDEY